MVNQDLTVALSSTILHILRSAFSFQVIIGVSLNCFRGWVEFTHLESLEMALDSAVAFDYIIKVLS